MFDRRELKGPSIYAIYGNIIDSELNTLKDFVEEIEQDLISKQQSVTNRYHKAIKKASDDEEINYIASFFDDDFYKYYTSYPSITLNPILLSVFGLFESWLKKLCEFDYKTRHSLLDINTIYGKNIYIDHCKKYLQYISMIDLTPVKNQWDKIELIKEIRNLIAHHGSRIKVKTGKEMISHNIGKALSNDNRFKIDLETGEFYIKKSDYLIEVIEIISDILSYLTNQFAKRKFIPRDQEISYNNLEWASEKVEELIKDLILVSDFFAEKKSKENNITEISPVFKSMAIRTTQLFASFNYAIWEEKDAETILSQKELGLIKLKRIYK